MFKLILFYLIMGMPILFILIGFFRSQVDGTRPEGFISVKEITKQWLNDNTWSARFSILFLPFLFVFNLLAWIVFGIVSLFEFVGFLFKKLWWIVLMVWNEVFHPTIFWFARLLWHYPIGFSWKLFEFSFSNINLSLRQTSIIYTLRKLIKMSLVGAVLTLIYLLFPHIVSLSLGILLFVIFFQYCVFQIITNYRPEYSKQKNKPSLEMVIIWLIVAVLTVLLLSLIKFLNLYSVSALGLTLAQFLIPVSFLAFIAFISAITCLPAYYKGVEALKTIEYLKAILYRLPKLIFAQPFQFVGLIIVGIVPFLLIFSLDKGVHAVTGRDFIGWSNEVSSLGDHLPSYMLNRKQIKINLDSIDTLTVEKDQYLADYNLSMIDLENQLTHVRSLANKIKDHKIHTFSGNAYVGEKQFFSIPEILNCGEYKWLIEREGIKVYEQTLLSNPENHSYIMYYTWGVQGQYHVSLTPSNYCGQSQTYANDVLVMERPVAKKAILNPIGKTLVCENDYVTYRTEKGYDRYEWRHPFGEATTSIEELSLDWGNISGTIQVRGLKNDGSSTLWRGTNVEVKSLPSRENSKEVFLENEEEESFKISRSFDFETREQAEDSLNKLISLQEHLSNSMNNFIAEKDIEIVGLLGENESLTNENRSHIHFFLGKIIAIIGLAIALSILLCTVFSYFLLFHYDLFDFQQSGPHYWQTTLSEIRLKNPQQPLLGIFILLVSVLIYLVVKQWSGLMF
jgi:hypothetical protein